MNITANCLQQHLDNIIRFLQPQLAFLNCHMVGYLTDNLWKTYIPEDIQAEVQTDDHVDDAVKVFWNFFGEEQTNLSNDSSPYSGIQNHLKLCQQYRMDNLKGMRMSPEQLRRELVSLGCNHKEDAGLCIKEFMSEKKNHEVEAISHLVASLCSYGRDESGATQHLSVIDAGDGKGYLSSRLALEHQLTVLGIDANISHTEGALKRTQQLEKAWIGLTKRAEDVKNGITPPRKGRRKPNDTHIGISSAPKATDNYRMSTHFITPETDFVQLFLQHFSDNRPSGFCLSGLHTCGDLAASCLKIFVENSKVLCVCNVGCCYHLLSEEFIADDFFVDRRQPVTEDDTDGVGFGFPMSSYLQKQEFQLGRNARMLAAQSLDRTVSARELPARSLFYRALLEVLLTRADSSLKNCVQVGRIKKCGTFTEYVRKCSNRRNLTVDGVEDEAFLEQLMESYRHEDRLLGLFYLIRMTYAPVLETLILLDRALYLKEQNVDCVFMVKLFDAVVSPRCYGLVALKKGIKGAASPACPLTTFRVRPTSARNGSLRDNSEVDVDSFVTPWL